jgi:hypothetical protein
LVVLGWQYLALFRPAKGKITIQRSKYTCRLEVPRRFFAEIAVEWDLFHPISALAAESTSDRPQMHLNIALIAAWMSAVNLLSAASVAGNSDKSDQLRSGLL